MNATNIENDMRYLQLLSQRFPTIADASTEIINLQAILNLPKGTEHFLADIHGEHEAFQHILKNASGNIKRKVNEIFGNEIRESDKKELCTLIYYPEQKLELVKESEDDIVDWYHITIHHLVKVCRDVSSKYTRSKVRKALPPEFSYIIQELLHERTEDTNKSAYVSAIIDTIISTGSAEDFIIAISHVIQRLAIDQLHILGDIYDRGPGAHIILDTMTSYHSWDIQWGNHDILWMGACAGNEACMCNVIRLSLRYANLTTLEEGYGINLIPLATFALETYGEDPCEEFRPRLNGANANMDVKTQMLTARMHKAISVLQLKTEAQLYDRHPEWNMEDRKVLSHVDYERGVYIVDGKEYEMTSNSFPTIDPAHPNEMTEAERELMLVAFIDGKHVGNCSLMSIAPYKRYIHRCNVAIALYKEYCGCGIGTAMLKTVLEVAQKVGYEQAELDAISTNDKAIALYEKLGFVKYGTLPDNVKYTDGTYADAVWMMKKL